MSIERRPSKPECCLGSLLPSLICSADIPMRDVGSGYWRGVLSTGREASLERGADSSVVEVAHPGEGVNGERWPGVRFAVPHNVVLRPEIERRIHVDDGLGSGDVCGLSCRIAR